MLCLPLLIVVTAFAVCSQAQDVVRAPAPPVEAVAEQGSVKKLVERIRSVIPKDWKASYEAEYAFLSVERNEPALASVVLSNGFVEEKPTVEKISFAFRVFPKMASADYQRLAAENDEIARKARAIYDMLVGRKIDRKFDEFRPHTEEDRKLIAQYEALKESRHSLPDAFYENLSLRWLVNGPEFEAVATHPVGTRLFEEFVKAREDVGKLLEPFGKRS